MREGLAQGYAEVRSRAAEVGKLQLRDLPNYFSKASERLNEMRGPQ